MRRGVTGRRPSRRRAARPTVRLSDMGDTLDLDPMIQRFRDRAHAGRERPLPPVAGEERQRFIRQAELDHLDYAIIGDAEGKLDDGILTLTVDLRPKT